MACDRRFSIQYALYTGLDLGALYKFVSMCFVRLSDEFGHMKFESLTNEPPYRPVACERRQGHDRLGCCAGRSLPRAKDHARFSDALHYAGGPTWRPRLIMTSCNRLYSRSARKNCYQLALQVRLRIAAASIAVRQNGEHSPPWITNWQVLQQ